MSNLSQFCGKYEFILEIYLTNCQTKLIIRLLIGILYQSFKSMHENQTKKIATKFFIVGLMFPLNVRVHATLLFI